MEQHLDRQSPTVVTQATTWWETVLACVKLMDCGLGVHLPVNVCYYWVVSTIKYIHTWWSLVSTAVDCGVLRNPVNGQVNDTNGTIFGQTATYSCNTGYNLVGNSTRMCQADGLWTGSAPSCERMLLLSRSNHQLYNDVALAQKIQLVTSYHNILLKL